MTIISIDFSILSPGVCVCKDFKEFNWLSVVNGNITNKLTKILENVILENKTIDIKFTETKRRKDSQYHITERIKLNNYIEATDLLIKGLLETVDLKDDLLVSIEGISFGSKGNALVDISQATGIIKTKIVDSLLKGDTDRFFVFSPSELKNAIGCKGNAPKGDILEAFKKDNTIPSLKNSELYKIVLNEDWVIDNKGNVISPIMDMIDAYLGVVKIHNIINT